MQMTIDQAPRPGLLLAFANRRNSGYMMRSERRSGYGGSAGGGNRRPPRRRRTSFLYIFLTLLVSLIIWPLGMVMLWRRKVTLQAGTKLLLSMMTLCVSIFLIVFALTVPVNNAEFTAFQDKTNDLLDRAGARVAVYGDAAYHKGVDTWKVMEDFGEAALGYSVKHAADGIDKGVDLSQKAVVRINALLNRNGGETPEPTPETAPIEETAAPNTAEPSLSPAASAPAETEPAPETAAPAVTPEGGLSLAVPDEAPDPDSGTPLTDGTLTAEGDFKAGETGTASEPAEIAEAEPSLSPLTTQSAVESIPEAGEAEAPAEDAGNEVAAEPLESGEAEPSDIAGAEDEETAEAETGSAPEAEEEEAPAEEGEEAVEAEEEETAEAEEEDAEAENEETAEAEEEDAEAEEEEAPEAEAESENTPEPTPEPTPIPELTVTVKPAGDAAVYFYNGGKAYHRKNCRFMGSDAPQRTLAEAVAAAKRICGSCNPQSGSILNETDVVWLDDGKVYHTTDECAEFSGDWTLISLEDAIQKGYEACPNCQADIYAARSGLLSTPEPAAEPVAEAVEPAEAPEPAVGETAAEAAPAVSGADEVPEATPDDGQPIALLQDEPSTDDDAVADSWTSEEELQAEAEAQAAEAVALEDISDIPIALKPAADAMVFHSSNGKFYHRNQVCKGMTGSSAFRFGEVVEQGYRQCPNCPAPAPELVNEPCLWVDADGLCHTTDECAAFNGRWTLVARTEAVAQNMSGCTACGGARYLATAAN